MNEIVSNILEIIYGSKPKRKRARNKDGTFKADNKDTKGKNEAWEVEWRKVKKTPLKRKWWLW